MNQHQQELRQAAAEAFIESLNQLQETLQVPAVVSTSSAAIYSSNHPADPNLVNHPASSPAERHPKTSGSFDLSSFEQAAADIEQFIQAKEQET